MRTYPTESQPATARAGISFVEVLATLAVGAIITMLAAPRVTTFRDRAAVRAARQELIATAEAARGAALQRSRRARFVVQGDSVRAVVDTGPPGMPATGTQTVLAPARFGTDYKVTIELGDPGDTVVTYDGRGLANPRLGRMAKWVIVGRTTRDSVCVGSMGTILQKGCSL
jgi:Tfp pilus assembly protein FimT